MTPPKWKIALDGAISEFKKQTVFQLATIEAASSSSVTSGQRPVRPHVRSHIFRSFLTPPSHPNLPLLLSSTDIRTPKVTQILQNAHVPVELAWWIEGKQQQFRITGRLVIVGSPQWDGDDSARLLQDLGKTGSEGMDGGAFRGIAALCQAGFSWEEKRVESFKNMSAHMKASWCRPTPGSPLQPDEAKKWPLRVEEPKEGASEGEKKTWETALRNFALVVIEPTFVDFLDLGVVPNVRWAYDRNETGRWTEEELVP